MSIERERKRGVEPGLIERERKRGESSQGKNRNDVDEHKIWRIDEQLMNTIQSSRCSLLTC